MMTRKMNVHVVVGHITPVIMKDVYTVIYHKINIYQKRKENVKTHRRKYEGI
jgi:hypothetical protein